MGVSVDTIEFEDEPQTVSAPPAADTNPSLGETDPHPRRRRRITILISEVPPSGVPPNRTLSTPA